MRYLKSLGLLFVVFICCLVLAGCGSSSSGSSGKDIFNNYSSGTVVAPSGSGTVLTYKMIFSTTAASGTGTNVGPNSTVIATAVLQDSSGNPIANQPIKFEAVEGPVTINTPIANTDSTGKSISFLKSGGTTTSAVDVIMKASTTVNDQLVTAISIFKIMRSESNVIKFITTKEPTDPDGTLNTLSVTVTNRPTTDPPRQILQLVPFEILDNNGVSRTRVPVKVSIYSQIGNCPVYIDSPETVDKTVTTDDNGIGIFNAGVTVAIPPVGSQNACSIIYRAEAVDPNNVSQIIYAYGGFIASVTNVEK